MWKIRPTEVEVPKKKKAHTLSAEACERVLLAFRSRETGLADGHRDLPAEVRAAIAVLRLVLFKPTCESESPLLLLLWGVYPSMLQKDAEELARQIVEHGWAVDADFDQQKEGEEWEKPITKILPTPRLNKLLAEVQKQLASEASVE